MGWFGFGKERATPQAAVEPPQVEVKEQLQFRGNDVVIARLLAGAGASPQHLSALQLPEADLERYKEQFARMTPEELPLGHVVETSTLERPKVEEEQFIQSTDAWRGDVIKWLQEQPANVQIAVKLKYGLAVSDERGVDKKLRQLHAKFFSGPNGEIDINAIVDDFLLVEKTKALLHKTRVEEYLEVLHGFLGIFGGEKTIAQIEDAILAKSTLYGTQRRWDYHPPSDDSQEALQRYKEILETNEELPEDQARHYRWDILSETVLAHAGSDGELTSDAPSAPEVSETVLSPEPVPISGEDEEYSMPPLPAPADGEAASEKDGESEVATRDGQGVFAGGDFSRRRGLEPLSEAMDEEADGVTDESAIPDTPPVAVAEGKSETKNGSLPSENSIMDNNVAAENGEEASAPEEPAIVPVVTAPAEETQTEALEASGISSDSVAERPSEETTLETTTVETGEDGAKVEAAASVADEETPLVEETHDESTAEEVIKETSPATTEVAISDDQIREEKTPESLTSTELEQEKTPIEVEQPEEDTELKQIPLTDELRVQLASELGSHFVTQDGPFTRFDPDKNPLEIVNSLADKYGEEYRSEIEDIVLAKHQEMSALFNDFIYDVGR